MPHDEEQRRKPLQTTAPDIDFLKLLGRALVPPEGGVTRNPQPIPGIPPEFFQRDTGTQVAHATTEAPAGTATQATRSPSRPSLPPIPGNFGAMNPNRFAGFEPSPELSAMDDLALAGRQAELVNKQTNDPAGLTPEEANELGALTAELQQRQGQRELQQSLILSLLPALLASGSQEAQFAQTQALAEQRFAAEQALTQEQIAARQQEQQQAEMARKTAAALIPELFPDLDIDPAVLANGIDPSILSVLITIARLRAEQSVAENRRSVVLPTFRFS